MECCNSFLDESPVYFDIIPISITLLFSSDWKNLSTIGSKINHQNKIFQLVSVKFSIKDFSLKWAKNLWIFGGAGTWFKGFFCIRFKLDKSSIFLIEFKFDKYKWLIGDLDVINKKNWFVLSSEIILRELGTPRVRTFENIFVLQLKQKKFTKIIVLSILLRKFWNKIRFKSIQHFVYQWTYN